MEEKEVEVRQVSEREIWVGESRFCLGEDNILYITIVGEQDKETAIAMRDALFRLLSMTERKVKIFADNSKTGKASPDARKIFQEMSEYEKVGKVAIFGLHPVARVIASFVMGITRKKDMLVFKTKEEALAWLKRESS